MEDVLESVRNLFKNKFNVRFIQSCKRESKNGTYKLRLLVLTDHRIFFLLKSPLCVEKFFYVIDIKGLECLSSDKLSITSSSKTIVVTCENGFMQTVKEILVCLKRIHPSVPARSLVQKLVTPSQKITDDILSQVEATDSEVLLCGGFASTYRCMCDFFTYTCLEDVIWDVESIYYLHDNREFNFRDFDYLDSKHHIPILASLQYNSYFTGLNLSNVKMMQQYLVELIKVLKTNCRLRCLNLSNSSLKTVHIEKLCDAISQNSDSSISFLDVSKNCLDEKSISNISSLNLNWKGLVLSDISTSQNSFINFFNSENSFNFRSLIHVDLSRNVLKKEASLALFSFLAHRNLIEKLVLEQCEVPLENCFDHFLKGCVEHLHELNLSGCHVNKKKLNDGILFRWKDFFSSVRSLEVLDLSHCHLTHDALKTTLLGLAVNPFISKLDLKLSGNCFDSKSLDVFEFCIPLLTKVTSFDISNNSFVADDLKIIFEKMSQMKSLKNLYVGKNLQNSKAKSLEGAIEAVVNYLKHEDLSLECLHLDDMSLKSEASPLLNHLGGNARLVELNISSNYIGPAGACLLSKALQINCKLKRIVLDRNDLNLQALNDISHALSRNYFLKSFCLPLHDILMIQKVNPDRMDRLEEVIKKIEHYINRNNSPALLLQEKRSASRVFLIQAAPLEDLTTSSNKLQCLINDIVQSGVSMRFNSTAINQANILLDESHAFIKAFNDYQLNLSKDETSSIDLLMKLIRKLKISGSAYQTESVQNLVHYLSKTCPKNFEMMKDRINFDEVKLHEIIMSPVLARIFEDAEHTLNEAMPFAILELLKVISELLTSNLEELIDDLTYMIKESQDGEECQIRHNSNYLKHRRSALKEEIRGLNESLMETSFLKATRMTRPVSSIIANSPETPGFPYLPILSDSLEHLNLMRPKPPKKHKAIVPILNVGRENTEPIKTPKPPPRKILPKEPKHQDKVPDG